MLGVLWLADEICHMPLLLFLVLQMPMLSNEDFLTPPKPEKMFLLSPPCSPPVDWKQKEEGEPVINLELIEALSKLSPGDIAV